MMKGGGGGGGGVKFTSVEVWLTFVHLQTQRWGSVEWQHDIEAQDLKSRMAATQLVASLS